MHSFYNFDFLGTISRELQEKLEELATSELNERTLEILTAFQKKHNARQGVYLIHYEGNPVYVGKTGNVATRLKKHLRKLTGRRNIDIDKVGYRALLLDKSMSTAANEELLIKLFKMNYSTLWNGQGFGTNDPGQRRDNTQPNGFDIAYPIKEDYPVANVFDDETVASLLKKMQATLPYVCRYNLRNHGNEPLDLQGVERTARTLMQAVVNHLGSDWKAGILSYGMVLYGIDKTYPFGTELTAGNVL